MEPIHSQSVILVERDANEIVPNAKLAADMHGFFIVVPPCEGGERFLNLVWRFTMLYAATPGWLSWRAKVPKMLTTAGCFEARITTASARLGPPCFSSQPGWLSRWSEH